MGFKNLIPGSGQWGVYTDRKDECWYCNQSIMTIFLWKPRVGQLNALKDPDTIRHYSESVKEHQKQLETPPRFYDGMPVISGPFNNWKPQKMRSILTFLHKNKVISIFYVFYVVFILFSV